MNERKNKHQLTSIERKAIKQLKQGKSLFGKEGEVPPVYPTIKVTTQVPQSALERK